MARGSGSGRLSRENKYVGERGEQSSGSGKGSEEEVYDSGVRGVWVGEAGIDEPGVRSGSIRRWNGRGRSRQWTGTASLGLGEQREGSTNPPTRSHQ
jgi:hypothetical protein